MLILDDFRLKVPKIAQRVHRFLADVHPSKHAYMGPIWATHMGPIWGVQPGLAWVPYGLAHMRVAQMVPIWVPYNSPIKKKEMI